MTIAIGVLCRDGVVIGADSSATLAVGQIPTVQQPVNKLFKIGDQALFAGSGEAGMIQRFQYHAEKYCNGKADLSKVDRHTISTEICKKVTSDFKDTNAIVGKVCAIMAFPSVEGHQLYEFTATSNLQPEYRTAGMWFAAIGSGQGICDPFLGFLRKVFFEGQMPKLQEGIFATVWALEHAFELTAGGIKGPASVGVLEREDAKKPWKARILVDDDLQEHRNMIQEAERHIAAFRPLLSGQAVSPSVPTTPPPKSNPVQIKNIGVTISDENPLG